MAAGWVLVTSRPQGLAGLFLDLASRTVDPSCRPLAVILCSGERSANSRSKRLRRRARKVWKVGLIGTLNGLRMRAWYGAEVCSALAAPDVREVCAAMRIPLKQIRGFWDADARQLFADLAPDLGVSIGNGLMPPEFFGIPRLGMINVHHEILPQYRGAQTAIWQIHDGSRETGFSIHNVDSRIDSGRILLRESMPIKFGRTLHETIVTTCTFVQRRSAEQLLRVVSDIERYRHEAIPNEGGTLYSTPSTTALMRIYRNHARLRTPRA